MEDKICDFRELLVEYVNDGKGKRAFRSLTIPNGWILSIQASKYSFCNPRETLSNIYDYSSMDMALGFNGRWALKSNETIKKFNRYEELMVFYEYDDRCPYYGYVPIDIIQDLYVYLLKIK